MSVTAGADGETGSGAPVAGPDGPWPAESTTSSDDAELAPCVPACCCGASGARAGPLPEPESWVGLSPEAWSVPAGALVGLDGGSGAGGGELVATESVDDELDSVEVDELPSCGGLPVLPVPGAGSAEPPVGDSGGCVPPVGAVASGSSPQAAGAVAARLASAISAAQARILKSAANRADLAKEDPGP
jgi:hypothetical protein